MPYSDVSVTVSDFDPEHEALASTRQMGSPRYSNVHDDEPDFLINTSTLDQCFPEFSQLPTSEEEAEVDGIVDDNSEPSMELGRAVGKSARRIDDSRDSVMSFQNSVRSSSPAVRVEYPTPQKNLPPPRSTTRRAVSENLRKDAQLRRANQAQKEHMMSPQVSKNQREQRRTLSDMHAKVRDNYDGSFLEDERPAPFETKSRSTRFSHPNNSQEIADAIERVSREAYAKEIGKGNSTASPRRQVPSNTQKNNMGDTMTRNSFLLPDLPNISELVSGVYEDGTPVFSHRRSTRFVSPPHDVTDVSFTREHMPLDAIPIPEDEKALFVSLRLLQDKVSELERFKSDAERRLEHYREENASLKTSKPRHSEKYTVDDAESRKASKRAASENQKLEAANIALQNQLDIADRKSQVQEAAVRRLNQDRESAISQLGVAYLEFRELKAQNEELRRENAELKSQLSHSPNKTVREQETADSEASLTGSDADESQMYTGRSADMSRSTKDLSSKSANTNTKSRRQDESRAKVSMQVNKEISRLEKERAEQELFSIDVPMMKRSSKSSKAAVRHPESKSAKKQPNTSKQRVKRVVVEDVSEPVEATEQSRMPSEVDELTLLSIIDENEIARLRKTLEEERLSRKQRRPSAVKEPTTTETVNTTRQSILKAPMPRKSSLREPKVQIPRPASAAGDITTRSVTTTAEGDNSLVVPTAERPRRHSDHSVNSVSSQRKKRKNIEDMTSAFILPDITLGRAELAASNPTRLPESDQRALDNLAQHEGKNCMICKNVLPNDTCNHEPVKVSKPVPVSDRMPKPSPYNEEPTMRPSQSPAVALATVLKTLEDELSHLKMQLATYQSAYNKLDVSFGKRQRKALLEKIETVLRDIDMKSDQIYALYDVLEGQKVGHDMTEQEMEMTLESIGIDITGAPDVTGTTSKSSRLAESDDEDELPWEGIESTAELTGRT